MRIEFQNVTKWFGGRSERTCAVDRATWEAEGGQVFGLLGPNGAGKTTIIRMILDILRPDSGQVLIEGVAGGNRTADFRRRVGYLPEERGLYQKRKALDVMLYFAALKGVSRREARTRALALLGR